MALFAIYLLLKEGIRSPGSSFTPFKEGLCLRSRYHRGDKQDIANDVGH